MNIFYLDHDPKAAAHMHCDQHVNKMIVESAQLLSTAHHLLPSTLPLSTLYSPTHANHPCAIWTRSHHTHYAYLYILFYWLCKIYHRRSNRPHRTWELLGPLLETTPTFPPGESGPPALAMPTHLHDPDPVTAYRNYYLTKNFATYRTYNSPPSWFKRSTSYAMFNYTIHTDLFPKLASPKVKLSDPETGRACPVGQILLAQGYAVDDLRLPSELKQEIYPFTLKLRYRIIDSPTTISLLTLYHLPYKDFRDAFTKTLKDVGITITFE